MKRELSIEELDDYYDGNLLLLVKRPDYVMYWKYDLDKEHTWFYSIPIDLDIGDRVEKGYTNDPVEIFNDYIEDITLVRPSDLDMYIRKSRRYVQ